MELDPLGSTLAPISEYGLAGLFGAAIFERFLPILPSHGFLIAVGIAANEGAWSLIGAILATTLGSIVGLVASFYAIRAIGEARSLRILHRFGGVFGMGPERMDGLIGKFRKNQSLLAFSFQLIPTVRLFAPAFAALLGARPLTYLAASAPGIVIWNALFLGIGYGTSEALPGANATGLALAALGLLLLVELLTFLAMRWLKARRRPALSE